MMAGAQMDPLELAWDALRELANISGGNAITALSRLLKGVRVEASLPQCRPVEDLGGQPQRVALVLDVKGTVSGAFAILLTEAQADVLGRELLGHADLQGLEHSALMEVSNILGCAFLDAATALVGQPLVPSPPRVIRGCLDEIASAVGGGSALVLSTGFRQADLGIAGEMVWILAPEGAGTALTRMGLEGITIPQ